MKNMSNSTLKPMVMSVQKCMILWWVFLKIPMEWPRFLCVFLWWNWGSLQKLQELVNTVGASKQLRFAGEEKVDSPFILF